MDSRLHGLYVITDATLCAERGLLPSVVAAIEGGAQIVQYRDKSRDTARQRAEAGALVKACRARDVLCIINDNVELAAEVGADGVHLGAEDGHVGHARKRLGGAAIIGVSCYERRDLAVDAAAAGADYVAFGSVFASRVKPKAVHAPLDLFAQAAELDVASCAIGGINAGNIDEIVRAGASMAAVISAVFAAPDITAASRALAAAFNRG